MENRIIEIAERIKSLREDLGLSIEEMANITDTTVEEFTACENGESDFSFTFLHKCAEKFGVDLIEIVTGENPHLSFYSVIRKGQGLPIKRRTGFNYFHLGPTFKNKLCEPFLVIAPYSEDEQDAPIKLSTHEGQEFNYVLQGKLKYSFDGRVEYLEEGDSVLYDSSHGHGMIAVGGTDCAFLSIVIKSQSKER